MRIQVAMAALTVASLFTACAKDGETGPAGPAGAQGNANVRSATFTVSPGDWSTISGGVAVNWSTSLITDAIANSGTVLVYSNEGGSWVPLPLTIGSIATLYQYSSGQVQIEVYGASAITEVSEFKIVAIASSGMIPQGVDVNDYEAVSAHFGLDK